MDLLFSSGSMVYNGDCFSGIYGIQCHETGKWYVGESIHVPDRVRCYCKLQCKEQPLIFRAIQKYGIESFSCYKLEECDPEILGQREIFWSNQLNSMKPTGYNLSVGKNEYRIISQETRNKMSEIRKGRPAHNKGISPSAESIEKQRQKIIGKKFSEEHRKKIAEANKKRKGMKYKARSEESKKEALKHY